MIALLLVLVVILKCVLKIVTEEAECVLYWEGDWPYGVCSSREGRPLDRGPTVAAVVPQDDLSRVGSPHHKVRMKPGESHRHYRRLRKEERTSDKGIMSDYK